MKRKSRTPRQKLMDELDKLWSLKVREPCVCELCGRSGGIKSFDAHHIKRRGNISTRWDLTNGSVLCKGCHRFKIHMDTFSVAILIEKLKKERGETWFPELEKRTNQIAKYSMQDLEDIKKQL